MKPEFKAWLDANYTAASASTHLWCLKRVEEFYGDLDALFDSSGLEDLAKQFDYSTADAKVGRPNPTKIPTGNNLYSNLGGFKSAIRCYSKFREAEGEIVQEAIIAVASEAIRERREGKQFELERHLQDSLRREIGQLEAGLTVIDGGSERAVDSGFIDILAKDMSGALTIVELKAGQAKREAVGQILGYMGDLKGEEPDATIRGIIVAASFDRSCRSAVAVVPSLSLREYRFDFRFSLPE